MFSSLFSSLYLLFSVQKPSRKLKFEFCSDEENSRWSTVEECTDDLQVPTILQLLGCEGDKERSRDVAEDNTQVQSIVQAEAREDVANELSTEEKSESGSELHDGFTSAVFEEEQFSANVPLISGVEKPSNEEMNPYVSFNSDTSGEMPSSQEEMLHWSLEGDDYTTSTASESCLPLGDAYELTDIEKIQPLGVVADDGTDVEPSILEAVNDLRPRVTSKFSPQVDADCSTSTNSELDQLKFMDETGRFLHEAVEPRVDMNVEEKFLDSMSRKYLLRLGYSGGHVGNRGGGKDKPWVHNFSRRKHGSVADTRVDVEAYGKVMRNQIKLTHVRNLKVGSSNSPETTTILSSVLVTWERLSTLCEVYTMYRGEGNPTATNCNKEEAFDSRRVVDKNSSNMQQRTRCLLVHEENRKEKLLDVLRWIGPFRIKEIM
ncbi:hypothetical protein R1sor_026187 [Riccia sorocarpa]|uniref:G-patch domain-containing protein n=1 Tax=Riccia sorocarpa TaxID=122646 RepID=A0ABD3GEQ3_9MARC